MPTVVAPGLSPADAARVELRLLRQARAAVARGDFTDALSPINEHTRRFKNGRLVEEREALRVKALGGLGRTEEARRAAIAFRARFPRSVLLPAVSSNVSLRAMTGKRDRPFVGRPPIAFCLGLVLAAGSCAGTLDAGSDMPHGLLPVDERNPVIIYNDSCE